MSKQNTLNASDCPDQQPGTAVILAAGEFPRRSEVLRLLDAADLIACCDRAAVNLVATGRVPGLIVGDLDSIPEELQARYAGRIVLDCGQDDNDLTKTFHEVIKLKPSVIHILGATGGREDHTLGNISLLADYRREIEAYGLACEIDMVSDYGVFCPATGSRTFESIPGQEISIFAFDNTLRVRAEGLDYPTDAVVFDSLWKASLNKASGTSFTLNLNHPAPYLVFFCRPGL